MDINPLARKVINRLSQEGFTAYLAGGCVRDHLLGISSEDHDIATNALPNEIVGLFDKTVTVGAQFGIVMVILEHESFEVATFRKDGHYLDGRRPSSFERSTPQEDALRRDFTINGMFYDPTEGKVIDYVGGLDDLDRQCLRTIGDPEERFLEDRLRMLRAIRFAHRLGFRVDHDLRKALVKLADQLFPAVSIERVVQEFEKMAKHDSFPEACRDMFDTGLLKTIFPHLKDLQPQGFEKRISSMGHFPKETPIAIYLTHLLGHPDEAFMLSEVRRLKLSRAASEHVKRLYIARTLSASDSERFEWAQFLANKDAELYLEVLELPCTALVKSLQPHVDRLRSKKPIISSKRLRDEGIESGPTMGQLIKEAERIAINQDILDASEVMKKLQKSSKWP